MAGIIRWLAPHMFPQLGGGAGGADMHAGATPPLNLTGADVPSQVPQQDWQKNFAGLTPHQQPSYQSALDAVFNKFAPPQYSVSGSGVGEPMPAPRVPQSLSPQHLAAQVMAMPPHAAAPAAPGGLPGVYPGLLYPRYGQQPQTPQSGLPKFTGGVSQQSGLPKFMGNVSPDSGLNPSSIRVDFHAPESPQ